MRLLLLTGVALGLVAAAVVASQLDSVRSLVDANEEDLCEPSIVYTRLPSNEESPDGLWKRAASYPISRDEVRAAAVGNRIYVGTGLTLRNIQFQSHDDFYGFDPAQDSYETLPPVPEKVDHAAFVGLGDSLYVIGGFVNTKPTAAVWRYSVKARRWDALAPMRIARGAPAAAAIGQRIYVVGGSRDDVGMVTGAVSSVEIYDIGSGTWARGPDMPTPRHHHGAAVVGGRLIVVGGRNDQDISLSTVEEFDPAPSRWSRLAPLPLGVGGLGVVAVGRYVVAVGGGDDDQHWVTPATWALDPARNQWQRLADLEVARHGHATAALGRDIFVFAGAPCPGYGRTNAVETLRATMAVPAR